MDKYYAKYLSEKTRQDYNLIAEHFSSTRQFLWEDLKPLSQYTQKGERILDLGCGNGRLRELFKDKEVEYTGIDNSEKLVGKAKIRYPEADFRSGDALRLPFPRDYFDKVFCIAVLHHVPSGEFRLEFLKEAKRVLRPGGKLILTVWNLWQRKTSRNLFLKNVFLKLIGRSKLDFKDIFYPWKGQDGKIITRRYFHLFTKGELKKLAKKAGFQIKEIKNLEREKNRGNNILLVAEKLDKMENLM